MGLPAPSAFKALAKEATPEAVTQTSQTAPQSGARFNSTILFVVAATVLIGLVAILKSAMLCGSCGPTPHEGTTYLGSHVDASKTDINTSELGYRVDVSPPVFQDEDIASAIDVPTSPDPVHASSSGHTLSPSRSRGNSPPAPEAKHTTRNFHNFSASAVLGEVVMPQEMASRTERVVGQTFGGVGSLPGQASRASEDRDVEREGAQTRFGVS